MDLEEGANWVLFSLLLSLIYEILPFNYVSFSQT